MIRYKKIMHNITSLLPISLAIEVLRTGNLLISKDEEKRSSFGVQTITSYLDTGWLRELSTETLINHIKGGIFCS